MPARELSDSDLITVARVAEREGWDDLARPPTAHGPRTLDEQRAVAAFAALNRSHPPTRARRVSYQAKVRIGLIVLGVIVLAACWWVSPERTALALLGAGLVCLVAMRRRRRREARTPRTPHPFSGGWLGPVR